MVLAPLSSGNIGGPKLRGWFYGAAVSGRTKSNSSTVDLFSKGVPNKAKFSI